MSAHDNREVDTGQGCVVVVGTDERLGDKARRRRKSWRVIVAHQVIIDGLRDVDTAQRIAGLACLLADDAQSVGGIIAADIEEVAYSVRLQDPEDLLAIFDVGFVARGTECQPDVAATSSSCCLVSCPKSTRFSLRIPATPWQAP